MADTTSQLFSPIRLRGVELANRIVYSPMGQYMADGAGVASDWHLMHLGSLALSGVGLIFTEATAVEPRGFYTPSGLGLWTDEQEAALARVVGACKRYSPARHGLQLFHAGRKGSVHGIEQGFAEMREDEPLGWRPVAPSDLPFPGRNNPVAELSAADLSEIVEAYAATTIRAARIGYEVLEIHGAHGYLIHSFLSPISNRRTDAFGGAREARMRFPLQVIARVRAEWPDHLPLGVRVSATDWIEGGWTIDDCIAFCRELKALGCDYVTASSGGSAPQQQIQVGPGYQLRFAEQIRREADIATTAVGLIWEPHFAEWVVASGAADLVALGRGLVADPRWAWRAADLLGGDAFCPLPYKSSMPSSNRRNLFRKASGWEARGTSAAVRG